MRIKNNTAYELLTYDELKQMGEFDCVIGDSDIASLILRFPMSVHTLDFGEDGRYYAKVVTESHIVPPTYRRLHTGEAWLKVYDDEGLTLEIQAKHIEVFQNKYGHCIIRCSQ